MKNEITERLNRALRTLDTIIDSCGDTTNVENAFDVKADIQAVMDELNKERL